MPSKLLILHGEAKFYCFTVSCVPESMFNYRKYFLSDFFRFDMLRIKYNSQTLACKQKTKVWLTRALQACGMVQSGHKLVQNLKGLLIDNKNKMVVSV